MWLVVTIDLQFGLGLWKHRQEAEHLSVHIVSETLSTFYLTQLVDYCYSTVFSSFCSLLVLFIVLPIVKAVYTTA